MGRPPTLNALRGSIARQAGLRLIISLGLFIAVLGLGSYQLYSLAVRKAAEARGADLANFYRTRLIQVDRDWESQTSDFQVRMEVTRLLERRQAGTAELQAFMTVQGNNRRFQYLLVQEAQGKKVFDFGGELDLPAIPETIRAQAGWYLAREAGELYRVRVTPIWLGAAGTGRMALFFKVDNALLFSLASPDVVLTARHGGQSIASSIGQAGLLPAKAGQTAGAEEREIYWGEDPSGATALRIATSVNLLFSSKELAIGAAMIPAIDGLILWLTLGFWLMRNAHRIKALGAAVTEFAQRHRPTLALDEQLDVARGAQRDEITDVAGAIEDMAEQAARRERERQDEEAQRRLWSMVFASSQEAIVITNADRRTLAVNAAFTGMTGYEAADMLGSMPDALAAGLATPELCAAMWREIEHHGAWVGEVEQRRKDGSSFPAGLSVSAVRDAEGHCSHYVCTLSDITERKLTEERFIHLANHDALTSLPNRHLLLDRLQGAISLSRRTGQIIGLLFLDLDNFKWVNDSLGHASGDQLLIAVAARLTGTVRSSDTVARLGGDEFVVLLAQAASEVEIGHVARKVIDALARPLELNGHDFHVTASLGVCVYPNDGNDPATLLKHADTAMYAAKAAGKNRFRFFDAAMNHSAVERSALEQDLRQALGRQEFELHYQPKLCAATQSLCGAEALIRWRHPRLGLLLPARFIPLAEETLLIIQIGEWVIGEACRQFVAWQQAGLKPRRIAVNLAAVQLESDSLVDAVERILRETGAPAAALEFELTESMVLRNPDRSVRTLVRLRELGIRLALDDFGTGYSSLSYLKRLPVTTLKIDRSFIEGLPGDPDDAQIARMIVALADSIRLDVVAEGIETPAQCAFLTKLGCKFLQGYLIARPLPASEYQTLLASDAPRSIGPKARCLTCPP
jgi:diguanylate cyclase (GGDEF)-like protein/PAS domain S-box-containing protein